MTAMEVKEQVVIFSKVTVRNYFQEPKALFTWAVQKFHD